MKVDFYLRDPGNHRKVRSVDMAAIPREGELVSLDEISGYVHSVEWIVEKSTPPTARVLLR